MGYEIDTSRPVLVTGATGYVAGWLVKRLLEEGVTVHAAVRDPERRDPARQDKVSHLDRLAESSPGTIRYFKADLLDDGSYADAIADCGTVFHTASPFTLNVDDPQRDLVDPALLGTKNVLRQAAATPSVKRVVLTSSCAAVCGDNIDIRGATNGTLTEEDWNTSSSVEHMPYYYSKTVAEQEAWRMAEAQDQYRLVTVNPHLVLGPGIQPHATSQSFTIMEQMADGTMAMGVPDIRMAMVDVRDVAEIHLHAAFHPAAHGRYLTFERSTTLPEMAGILRSHFDGFPFPKRTLPKWLVWLVGPWVDKSMTRRAVSRNVGISWVGDNGKSRREFDFTYRPTDHAIIEMFQQMIDAGRVKPR